MSPLIAPSARKHGIHDDDMIHAFHNPIDVEDVGDGFMTFVGADRAGNLLEVGAVEGTDGPVIVHAMRARPKYQR